MEQKLKTRTLHNNGIYRIQVRKYGKWKTVVDTQGLPVEVDDADLFKYFTNDILKTYNGEHHEQVKASTRWRIK